MTATAESTRLVTFRLGQHLFAAEIHAVQRVLRHEPPRALPDMPDWMEGVVDYQGTVVPVIDMRRRFGLPATTPGPQSRLMVCSASGGQVAMPTDPHEREPVGDHHGCETTMRPFMFGWKRQK